MKQTSNAQRSTFNVELGRDSLSVGRWALNVGRLLHLLIGAVFIYAGVLKALDPIGLASDIENYHIVPWPVGVRLAFYLPWLEICCGLALWLRRAMPGALTILATLTLIFIAASVVAKARGLDVSCGCFGHAARNLSFTWHLAIDIMLLAAIAFAGWRELRVAHSTRDRSRLSGSLSTDR